ncbi:MAG: helix-turn-helix domain-containing protein [Faecalicatena sp.]|uniref:helix-turn-helix domain-containing protein n=1 Tax=Faecalicatena sp. TaxID=2005360 RepID=UPI002591063A|nr:helix-turn-helix domain-containing protein [Faecalicatena sp.]MCI6468135.1 helix-turn-helix domain-containing protein [Faecalicatena sp.]MDY5620388.1 helix-turn-helix domain-containing protein [Lachnospiraceae bacterium]
MAKGKYQEWLEPEGLLKIEGWARDGLTDKQIAHNIGVTEQTLNNWKNNYPSFFESLKRGKEVIDRQVENALLKRALGYNYDEVTQEIFKNPETGETELKVTKVVTKQVSPDTTAQIFWLKNRKPEEWRDRKDLDLSGGLKVENPYEGLTTEELKKLIHDG